ncbi:MFS general substrate transporter [Mycena crocata]|nr:MFS general substrate transporter [Mycena crocata]
MLPSSNRILLCFSIAANVLCAGGVFTFPLLSPVLAQHVKLTQPQLTSIVLAGMAGQYPCTPLVGKIVDRHGPWLCSLIASILFSVAFGSFSYQVHRMLENSDPPSQASVYLLVLLFALAGFGTVFGYFSSLFAATRNFPEYPGVASGTVMALFGLSPLLLSYFASTYFTSGADTSLNLVGFLSFLAILTGVVHVIGSFSLRVPKEHPPTISVSQDAEARETTALLAQRRNNPSDSALHLLRDPYFWVLFMLLIIILGPCEMVISNVGTIVLSLPSVHSTVPSGPSAVASMQFSPRRHYISRAAFLVGAATVLAFAFLWMEVGVRSRANLWVLSVGTGIAYGATFTVLPSIITSVWGAQNAGRNFGIVVYAPLTGTTLFSYLYAFISAHHTPDGGYCQGPACWQATFWVSAVAQVAAILGGLVLWRGWKGLL